MNLGRNRSPNQDGLFAQALAVHEDGHLEEAERLYVSILCADGGHFSTLLHLGVLRLQQGRAEEAINLTQRALRVSPTSAEAHANLGTAFHLLSRDDKAIVEFEEAFTLDPGRAETQYGLAVVLSGLKRREEAIAAFQRALFLDPDYAEAHCGLGAVLLALRRPELAIECFDHALGIDPEYVEAMCGMAEGQQALQRHDDAVALLQRAIALQPEHAPSHYALGLAHRTAGRHTEAIDSLRAALALRPQDSDAWAGLGATLLELGRISEAKNAIEQAFMIAPGNLHYLFALVTSGRVHTDDPAIAALQAQALAIDSLGDKDRIILHFALGKALMDVGRNEESFSHLLAGNALKRKYLSYDESATLAIFDRIRSMFTRDFIAAHIGNGNPSSQPIFIVGMPRSGSTLVEQIIASHPAAFGAGERSDFASAVRQIGLDCPSMPFPAALVGLEGQQLERLGSYYLKLLRDGVSDLGLVATTRITDKMLANFAFVGLIHLSLPEARIIFTRRNPIDTCLSCFSKLFADEHAFTYDLGELGRYYRACEALMDHWKEVIPPGVILEVQYEELVANFETQARRLIAHCGLEWDPICLAFHQTERVVKTASATQVREAIYGSSVNRWQPSRNVLRPLLDALFA